MKNLILTEEEKRIVLPKRQEAHDQEQKKKRQIHTLKVAYDYAKWLYEEGAGSTFSTFCDDFGYKARPNEDRSQLYKHILEVIKAAG